MFSDYGKYVLLPEDEFQGFQPPEPTLPRVANIYADWINGCKTGSPTIADFIYSAWLTESNHLGNVAFRLGKTIEWDADQLACPNAPEAAPLLRREYRAGWELEV